MSTLSTDAKLEPGDRLTRAEFERRYVAMPHVKKAELIEGVVYMPSPVRLTQHAEPHSQLIGWLTQYVFSTPGVRCGDNATIRLDFDNEPQPDAILMIDPKSGGQAKLSSDGYIEGAPELVAEVASSSVSFDLHTKLAVYRRNGVCEYLVWRVLDQQFDWFLLQDDVYIPLPIDEAGILKSRCFPGLWLDPVALTRGEMLHVVEIQRQGLASLEHDAFIQG